MKGFAPSSYSVEPLCLHRTSISFYSKTMSGGGKGEGKNGDSEMPEQPPPLDPKLLAIPDDVLARLVEVILIF